MKILKSRIAFPIIFFIYGLFYFFEPILAAWFEIVDPSIAKVIFLPLTWASFILLIPIALVLPSVGINNIVYIPDFLFLLISFFYFTYFVVIFRKAWAKEQKILASLPILIFPLIWVILLPIGTTYIDRRVNSYSIGGWSLLLFAGGSEIVHTEGIKLIESTKQESPTENELPSSIKNLSGWVKIEQDKQLLLVGRGRMIGMADEFGFIIQKENGETPIPHYLEKQPFYRIWKLANGIYFFEQ